MELRRMIYRNLACHKVRTALTTLAAAVALFGFCMIRTFVDSWSAGMSRGAEDRLLVRNSVSLIFFLPLSYAKQIAKIDGVINVVYAIWFGGEYKDNTYQFSQFAVSDNYFEVVPELSVPSRALSEWHNDRRGILIGEQLAKKFSIKPGDVMQIRGTIFPALFEFKVSGIFTGRQDTADERQVFFHWSYLNERNRMEFKRQPDHVGFYSVLIKKGYDTAKIAKDIDNLFANSYAETKTETESEFLKGYVSMSSAIITTMNFTSVIVLITMLLVVTNSVLLSFRERRREYAILKAMGFRMGHLCQVVFGESLLFCLIGLAIVSVCLAVVFSIPRDTLLGPMASMLPGFSPSVFSLVLTVVSAVIIAIFASIAPLLELMKQRVVDGLKNNF